MRENIVKTKSFAFALRVVKLYKFMVAEHNEYVLSKQVLRSGTAIGAAIRESEFAESKKDFVHKLSIALKEANETQYWLELLHQSEFLDADAFHSIVGDIEELLKLLTTIIKKTKSNEIVSRSN